MSAGGPAFVPYRDDLLLPQDVCKLITHSGGLPVMAHPGQFLEKVTGTAEAAKKVMEGFITSPSEIAL